MTKVISSVLAFTILFTITEVPSFAQDNQDTQVQRESELFEIKVQQTSNDITISNTRKIPDFAGNEYTLIECEPKGYYIYHNSSGNFVEFSPESISPYKRASGNIYYCGPGQYYEEKNGKYSHLLDENTEIDKSENSILSESCNKINNDLNENKNTTTLNFINSEISKSSYTAQARFNGKVLVPQANYIKGLDNCGTNYNGTCGYIAASIVLYYWQRRLPDYTIIDRDSWNNNGLIGNILHDRLHAFGSSNGTKAWDISAVLNDYCGGKSYSFSSTWSLAAVGADTEIRSGRPVMLFGAFSQTTSGYSFHAVAAYGTAYSGTYEGINFVVHLGYPGYSYVMINGVIGSTAKFMLT